MSEDQGELPLLFEVVDEHIAVVRFNRPRARNAVSGEVARLLSEAVTRVEADDQLRVAILSSSTPGIFSAGADLKEVSAGLTPGMRIGDAGFGGFVDALKTKPWIAAVDGPALAGGCEICLACDMIIASPGSSFGLPEVKRGLMAGAGGVHRLARLLPRNIALELVATGDPITADVAAAFGMVNRLVAPGDVLETALELARKIIANAPISVRESLSLARMAADCSDADLRRVSREKMRVVMSSEDAREGPKAFVERRAPQWQGR